MTRLPHFWYQCREIIILFYIVYKRLTLYTVYIYVGIENILFPCNPELVDLLDIQTGPVLGYDTLTNVRKTNPGKTSQKPPDDTVSNKPGDTARKTTWRHSQKTTWRHSQKTTWRHSQ